MISYITYSTICLGLVLLFYHAFLAREKIYQINRFYLLIGLLFSLAIPFIPVGIADSLLPSGSSAEIPSIVSDGIEHPTAQSMLPAFANSTGNISGEPTFPLQQLYPLLFYLYGVVTLLLSVRMIRHLFRMQLKTMKNPATSFRGHKVVLLDQDVVPHTFWKTIFVNKEQFEKGTISEEMLMHELFHARQNHTLDILIVEILKTICWFNPLLYFYKTAIQVNHEYIADHKVLSNGADVAAYQTSLLNMRTAKSAHYLSTSLNFNITKKRFRMMTLKNSTSRSTLKTALIIPFFVMLGTTFGCEPANMEKDHQMETVSLELVDTETIILNGKTVSASEFETAFSDLALDPENTIIDFKVHENTSMGLVTDVQEFLREAGTLRLNYSTTQPNNAQPKEDWRTNLDSRNILDILISKEEDLLINEEPVSLSEVDRLVREFITNNGKSADLSESPVDAIVAIKVAKNPPYDIYSSTVEKVIKVYDDLRNQASVKLFDQPFQSLEEGSKEREQIKGMYPKRISINEPFNS